MATYTEATAGQILTTFSTLTGRIERKAKHQRMGFWVIFPFIEPAGHHFTRRPMPQEYQHSTNPRRYARPLETAVLAPWEHETWELPEATHRQRVKIHHQAAEECPATTCQAGSSG